RIGGGGRDPGTPFLAHVLDIRGRDIRAVDLDPVRNAGFIRAELYATSELIVRREHDLDVGIGAQGRARLGGDARSGIRVDSAPPRLFENTWVGLLDLGPD